MEWYTTLPVNGQRDRGRTGTRISYSARMAASVRMKSPDSFVPGPVSGMLIFFPGDEGYRDFV
jgi:hypothetical protein